MAYDGVRPWERQHGETAKAYEAFCVFRDLGEGRTIQTVTEKLRKSYDLLRRWAKRWDWQSRADAWDASITEEARQSLARSYRDMLERQMKIGRMMQVRAANNIEKRDLDKASIHSLVIMANSGVEIERSAYEMAMAPERGETKDEAAVGGAPNVEIYLPDNGRDG